MKKKFLAFLLLICSVFCLVSCDFFGSKPEKIDYASQVSLDTHSSSLKEEVTLVNHVDGDTSHFKVPASMANLVKTNLLKARYAAVNTPESTGKIEEWGKKASNYTKNALTTASSIVIESDGAEWEVDSTGERFLVWVWYKPEGGTEYKNLNLELLQEGLAWGSKANSSRYGELAVKAISQASELGLHVHGPTGQDPDFYYGAAKEVNLKELRLNIKDYTGMRVSFEGLVTQYSSNGVYVEEYDTETDMYYGIYVYYGFDLGSDGEDALSEGNHVRVVGEVSYYETGNSYQVCDLEYDIFEPDNPENLQLISEGNPVANTVTTAEKFLSKISVTVLDEEGEEVSEERKYADVAINTSISMKNLKVEKAYTTDNDGNNDGAMTLTCTVDGKTVTVRTMKLYHGDKPANGLVTQDELVGKTIDVVGIIDSYNGEYQIKVFAFSDITIH